MDFLCKLITCCLLAVVVKAQLPPCEICDDGGAVGNPDTVIPQGFVNVLVQDMTCAEVQQMGADGVFNVIQCVLLQQSDISDSCGCGGVSLPVTPPPITSPTAPPVAPVVPEPVPTAPPVETTEAPAPAATETPVEATEAPMSIAATAAPTPAATETPAAAILPTGTKFRSLPMLV